MAGVEYKGLHEPLVDSRTFFKVQDRFAARTGRTVRDVKHRHYLKGMLVCGVCGRGPSIQRSKNKYVYFYCLGQKDRRRPTGCQEAYIAAGKLERQVEELYDRVQLPPAWAERLRSALVAEVIARQDRNSAERDFIARRLTKLETERGKLLEAYYAGATDVALLRTEQERIGRDAHEAEERLAAVDATLGEWQEVLGIALKFASNCAGAYSSAKEQARKLYNSAVIERLVARGGEIVEVRYQPPFELVFGMIEFEQGGMERGTGITVPGTKEAVEFAYRPASDGRE